MRLYLQKNEKNIEKNRENGNEKLPYFTLKRIPEEGEENQNWIELGAFWKGKNGYTGKLAEGVEITIKKKELIAEEKEKLAAIKAISTD